MNIMIKKILTPATIAIFLWGTILLLINQYYYEYVRYYLYISILVIFPFMIWNLIKQWKKDKAEETKEFRSSIFRMLIMAVVMILIFYVTKQNHI
ncbi:hypothetical protein [Flavobacterium sp. KACC 22763]|uniref:hypothetical protein n=1 Tax=Flavobacterium sp. KACC 22763 TaxID=3025668 RepID=UPI002366036D|nr:hypothetical protein [Flavobacterium sp. KACC 22763]WDF65618.1 hypothetical protein PQ463_05495 [Flavobacterium sp. KACC 22763]